jgi:hypothetical protein
VTTEVNQKLFNARKNEMKKEKLFLELSSEASKAEARKLFLEKFMPQQANASRLASS